MDQQHKDDFDHSLEKIQKDAEFNRAKAAELRAKALELEEGITAAIEEKDDKIIVRPDNLWKAPPGWTPPGWKSDEENMSAIQALMGNDMTGDKKLG